MQTRALVLAAVLAGCGGSIAVEDVLLEVERAECSWFTRCHLLGTQSPCPADEFSVSPDLVVVSVQAGRLGYDGNGAADCVDGIRSASCDRFAFDATVGRCDRQSFQGLVPVGGTCFFEEECADHGGCGNRPVGCNPGIMCCAGTCGAARAVDIPVGSSCASGACVEGAYCAQPAQVCTAASDVEGMPCTSGPQCAFPLRCLFDPGSTTVQHCQRPVGDGGACDPSVPDICQLVYETCDTASRTCRPRPGLNQACTVACIDGLECLNSVCVPRGEVGAPCGGANPGCAGSLRCQNGTCAAPPLRPACP
jgi:hypothetical protein